MILWSDTVCNNLSRAQRIPFLTQYNSPTLLVFLFQRTMSTVIVRVATVDSGQSCYVLGKLLLGLAQEKNI